MQERVAYAGGHADGVDHARQENRESRGQVAIAEADVEFGRLQRSACCTGGRVLRCRGDVGRDEDAEGRVDGVHQARLEPGR